MQSKLRAKTLKVSCSHECSFTSDTGSNTKFCLHVIIENMQTKIFESD